MGFVREGDCPCVFNLQVFLLNLHGILFSSLQTPSNIPPRQDHLGAALIKQVASKTNDVAGDGTTTSTVLARAIFRAEDEALDGGMP